MFYKLPKYFRMYDSIPLLFFRFSKPNNDVIIIFKMSWQFHNKAKYLASPANSFTLHKNQQS